MEESASEEPIARDPPARANTPRRGKPSKPASPVAAAARPTEIETDNDNDYDTSDDDSDDLEELKDHLQRSSLAAPEKPSFSVDFGSLPRLEHVEKESEWCPFPSKLRDCPVPTSVVPNNDRGRRPQKWPSLRHDPSFGPLFKKGTHTAKEVEYLIPLLFYQYVTLASLNSAILETFGDHQSAPLLFRQVLANLHASKTILGDRAQFYYAELASLSPEFKEYLQEYQRAEELDLGLFEHLGTGAFEAAQKFQRDVLKVKYREAQKAAGKAKAEKKKNAAEK